jgi:hypothetical protein
MPLHAFPAPLARQGFLVNMHVRTYLKRARGCPKQRLLLALIPEVGLSSSSLPHQHLNVPRCHWDRTAAVGRRSLCRRVPLLFDMLSSVQTFASVCHSTCLFLLSARVACECVEVAAPGL